MKKRLLAVASLLAISFSVPASAADTFNFTMQVPSFGGSSILAIGLLTCAANLAADSSCTVTGISGNVSNPLVAGDVPQAITGLSSYNSADNKIYFYPNDPNYPFHGDLTLGGLSFTTSSATNPFLPAYNIFSLGFSSTGALGIRETNSGPSGGGLGKGGTPAIFALSRVVAVPEPATWAMMLVGFGAAGVSLRRSRRTTLSSSVRARLAQAA